MLLWQDPVAEAEVEDFPAVASAAQEAVASPEAADSREAAFRVEASQEEASQADLHQDHHTDRHIITDPFSVLYFTEPITGLQQAVQAALHLFV